jgi:LCP family protein required for cell wall assembly
LEGRLLVLLAKLNSLTVLVATEGAALFNKKLFSRLKEAGTFITALSLLALVVGGAVLYSTVDAFYYQPFNPLGIEERRWEPALQPVVSDAGVVPLSERKRPYTFGEKRRNTSNLQLESPATAAEAGAQRQTGATQRGKVQAAALPAGPGPDAAKAKGNSGDRSATAVGDTAASAENGRVTILLMGIDRRPDEPFISRTDTMMLLSFHPEAGTASILSIPRDLYVPIPGHGQNRINTAFLYGAAGNNPAAGAELAMETVSQLLDVSIDHYILVDFSAFIQTIDLLGGIHVNVPYTIDDPRFPDMHYGFEPLYIPAGLHQFDGETALKYARTRGQDNDFYRAQRQQQVVLAVRRKAMQLGLPSLIARAPGLYRQVSQGVYTDLSLDEMIRLAQLASLLESEAIETAVLDFNYVSSHRSDSGAHVLLLSQSKVEPLIQQLFGDSRPAATLNRVPSAAPPMR